MADFVTYAPSYCNHVGSCMHPNQTIYKLLTWRLNGAGPFSLQIWEHKPPYSAAPTLKRTWKQTIDVPGPFGYGDPLCLPDGSLYIAIPGGVQTENQIQPSYRIEPGICDPYTPQNIRLFTTMATSPKWEGVELNGSVSVNIPLEFKVPVAPAYLVRFVAQSPSADVRVRAGSDTVPHMLTVNTQLPNLQVHSQGWAPGPIALVSAVKGPAAVGSGSATVWFQICGYAS